MGVCCLLHALETYLRLLSDWLYIIITTCVIWIPLSAVLLYLLGVFIRRRALKLLPHLRKPTKDGKKATIIGFFHPYCNAGGGGERVLWVAIRALQNRYPNVRCVVYTGDIDASREEILTKARHRFNVIIPRTGVDDLEFVFLQRRQWVEAAPYPMFTLLGQSFGSFVLGMEAVWNFVPEVYLDTMGYAFTLPIFKYLGGCKVGCYVHYPTISTDMLEKVSSRTEGFNNASFISRNPVLSSAKLIYYKLFAYFYGVVGNRSDVIMVNSTWTYGHISTLWNATDRTHIVYPPCDTEEFMSLPLVQDCDRNINTFVSIGQFRPEKDHPLQIKSFHSFLAMLPEENKSQYKLIIIGSCRNSEDRARVEALRDLASTIGIEDQVEFKLNVSFDELKDSLSKATIGIHTMWNEHFGIGVVEMMAAGTVTLAHHSGGPKLDIVIEYNDKPTGYLASDITSYAKAMKDIMDLSTEERLTIRENGRASVHRFSEEEFENGFLASVEPLILK